MDDIKKEKEREAALAVCMMYCEEVQEQIDQYGKRIDCIDYLLYEVTHPHLHKRAEVGASCSIRLKS